MPSTIWTGAAIVASPVLGDTFTVSYGIGAGAIVAAPVVSGSPTGDFGDGITTVPVLGGSPTTDAGIDVAIVTVPVLGGEPTVTRIPNLTDPDDYAAVNGNRPSTPTVVRSMLVASSTDLATLTGAVTAPFAFVVSVSYDPSTGTLGDGVDAGYVGFVSAAGIVLYRAPRANEVVWFVATSGSAAEADGGLYRYDASPGIGWKQFVPLPEKVVAAIAAFDTADPDHVYSFYARLVGAVQAMLTADAVSLIAAHVPDEVPASLLPRELASRGLMADPLLSLPARRAKAATSIVRARDAGTIIRAPEVLASLGYSGYLTDAYVDPTSNRVWSNLTDAPTTIKQELEDLGLSNSVDDNSGQKGDVWLDEPHEQTPGDPYVPSGRVVVHVNNADGTPLSADMPVETVAQVIDRVTFALVDQVLPATASIRAFYTDDTPPRSLRKLPAIFRRAIGAKPVVAGTW